MNRLKALYRSWAIPSVGKEVYATRHRAEWLGKISEAGVRRRAEYYYQQLDVLRLLRQEVRRDLLLEAKKHKAWKLLRQIPGIGAIRAAVLRKKFVHREFMVANSQETHSCSSQYTRGMLPAP
jgi:transposase